MLLKALKPLADLRLAGELPNIPVQILLGDYEQPKWWQWHGAGVEVVMSEKTPMARLDLRPLVGLKVCVQADRYSDALMRLCDRMKEYASAIDVFVIDWMPEELGFRWDRGMTEYQPIAPKKSAA